MTLLLPFKNDEKYLFGSVMDCFRQYGEELAALVKSVLDPIYGENLLVHLANDRPARINLEDISFLLKEITRNPNSPLRLCLPRGRQVYDEMDVVLSERNKWVHNEIEINIDSSIKTVKAIHKSAKSIGLELEQELENLLKVLDNLKQGINIQAEKSSDLKIKIDDSRVKIEQLQEESNLIQQQLSQAEFQISDLQKEVNQRNQLIEKKNTILQNVETEKDSLRLKIAALQDALAQVELEKKSLETLSNNYEKIQVEEQERSSPENLNISPGEVWPGVKGDIKLTLSPRFKDLYVTDSCTLLSDVLGEQAKDLAKEWLNIKHTGGTIWVDKYGCVTTYVGESLCYLGSLSADHLHKFSTRKK
jgi:hypothetical protein